MRTVERVLEALQLIAIGSIIGHDRLSAGNLRPELVACAITTTNSTKMPVDARTRAFTIKVSIKMDLMRRPIRETPKEAGARSKSIRRKL